MKIIRFQDKDEVPASHEDPLDPGAIKRVLLSEHRDIHGHIQMINWATLLPGKSFRAHYHEDMIELFLMIEDGIVMMLDGKDLSLSRGDVVVVYPNEIHEMRNTTDTGRSYLVIGISGDKAGKSVNV